MMRTWTIEERSAMRRAFDRGNYANAYETTEIATFALDEMTPHERAAFVLGFFASYALHEIIDARDTFDECYFSDAGQYVVNVAHYADARTDEYRSET